MRLASVRLSILLAITGCSYVGAILTLVITRTPLGSGLFLAVAGITTCAYAVMLGRVWNEPLGQRRLLLVAFVFALLFRIPPAIAPVGPDSDMVRYLWDGRLQALGYNPYRFVPADPALGDVHTKETSAMPSRRHRTPYPPAAQLFFRLVVAIGNTTLAMKLALVACDVLTLVVLWQWLAVTNRNQWLALAYGWHPLVILEVAHSGHIDVLGALWITASAYWLTTKRTALASIAFVLAVATKLLPIVLAPLFFKRVRWRDVLLAAGLAVALYAPFTQADQLPLGAVPNVVLNIRFNGPVFRAISWVASPQVAAAFALTFGLGLAVWARRHLPASEPAAWAWPMAGALVAAPVIYPWYLLCLTPFLSSLKALPIAGWTISVIPVYLVWRIAREGGIWHVPPAVLAVEYGVLLSGCAALFVRSARHRDL
jgi:alpha-1,6-mannosyltransferase